MLTPNYELELITRGSFTRVIGIDEVGRGAWAGPVSVGYYIVDMNIDAIPGVRDSKKLKASQREELSGILSFHQGGVLTAEVQDIDVAGINAAIVRLMKQVIATQINPETFFLIDGRFRADFGPQVSTIIRGDDQCYSIAAASIMAKVWRDQLMVDYGKVYAEYGFGQHKGYGTSAHRHALQQFGPCEIHRRSFTPIRNFGQ